MLLLEMGMFIVEIKLKKNTEWTKKNSNCTDYNINEFIHKWIYTNDNAGLPRSMKDVKTNKLLKYCFILF